MPLGSLALPRPLRNFCSTSTLTALVSLARSDRYTPSGSCADFISLRLKLTRAAQHFGELLIDFTVRLDQSKDAPPSAIQLVADTEPSQIRSVAAPV